MADQREDGISWTDETWNPVVGCSIVSPACTNCYAMSVAASIERRQGSASHYFETTKVVNGKPVWTGNLKLSPNHIINKPLSWQRERRVFVNSMSDLFHENMPEEWIDRVFATMALSPRHTFQVLTKRPERMRLYVSSPETIRRVYSMACDIALALKLNVTLIARREDAAHAPPGPRVFLDTWPLPNVWLGVTAEDQTRADERVPSLLETPAVIRFVSAEPLLGAIDFNRIDIAAWLRHLKGGSSEPSLAPGPSIGLHPHDPDMRWPLLAPFEHMQSGYTSPGLDWIIVGGESGPSARPTHPDWVRSIRDQCAKAGVAFHFKQWGDLAPVYDRDRDDPDWQRCAEIADSTPKGRWMNLAGGHGFHGERVMRFDRIGKKLAGRLLDGAVHDAFPRSPA